MPDSITPRQAALWFATKGYPVLPLHSITESNTCTCGKSGCQSPGKHPYAEFTPHGVKDAITDVDTVRAWFDERYWLNYGVATDALDLVQAAKLTTNNSLTPLVVLDNARSPDQIRPLLPHSRGCAVLVTSRDDMPGLVARDGASRMALDLLNEAEAELVERPLTPLAHTA